MLGATEPGFDLICPGLAMTRAVSQPRMPRRAAGQPLHTGNVSPNQDTTVAPLCLRSLNKAFFFWRKPTSVSDLDSFEFQQPWVLRTRKLRGFSSEKGKKQSNGLHTCTAHKGVTALKPCYLLTPVLDKEEKKKQFLTDHSNTSESSSPLRKSHF